MKLFKKALLATAVFGAMGAQAASVSSDPIKLSSEGIAAGLTATNVTLPIDIVINAATPAASTITLTFDDNVDLSELEALQGAATSVPVYNDINTGRGYVDFAGDADTTLDEGVAFNYGTGSFTFDRFSVDADAGTITFDVNLGNAITADSAFRVTFDSTGAILANDGIEVSGGSSVTYSSVDSNDVALETGSGVIAIEESQFAFAVAKGFDGRIERVTQQEFSRNGDDATNATIDTLAFTFSSNESLEAALATTDLAVEFAGDFDNGATVAADQLEDGDLAVAAAGAMTVAADFSSIDFALGAAPAVVTGAKNTYTVTFTGNTGAAGTPSAIVIPQTGNIEAKATVSATAGGAAITPLVIASDVDAGSWALDATVINIPYFPVGFEGLSTSVHFANESANDADVIVTAIDQAGNEYDGTLADLAGDTVTKVSQVAIMEALGAPAGSKLSVTFNIDANEGDVNAYAFSNAGTGRQALVTSQEKGIK
ncbi:hypothetical protein [Pseudoalteromonas sp. L1]|uniref:hypothetical protein n=1 Tax=Pseudoalteromonas sp. L1 TaxID=195716 RepID=UPI001F3EC5C2|nr:hypothetical protein [Pseudoalteromonas sp. L1]